MMGKRKRIQQLAKKTPNTKSNSDWKLSQNIKVRVEVDRLYAGIRKSQDNPSENNQKSSHSCRLSPHEEDPLVTSSKSKILLDELHNIFSECQPNCAICDNLIHELSQHIRVTHPPPRIKSPPQILLKCYPGPKTRISTRNRLRNKVRVSSTERIEFDENGGTSKNFQNYVETEEIKRIKELEPDFNNMLTFTEEPMITVRPSEAVSGFGATSLIPQDPLFIDSTEPKQLEVEDVDFDIKPKPEDLDLDIDFHYFADNDFDHDNNSGRNNEAKDNDPDYEPYLNQEQKISLGEISDSRLDPQNSGNFQSTTAFLNLGADDVQSRHSRQFKFRYKRMSSGKFLNRHRHTENSSNPKSYLCKVCEAEFTAKKQLTCHVRSHGTGAGIAKRYTCEICNEGFSLKKLQIKHMMVHRKPKPTHTHSCEVCGKTLKFKRNLVIHMRIHTGERPYECDICKKSFISDTIRYKHRLTHNLDRERTHICDRCGKAFEETSKLIAHIRIHTGEKPFICDICDKCFRIKTGLTIHKMSHTGERPFMCEVCSARFVQRNELNRHMRNHTTNAQKYFICEVCGAYYLLLRNLKLHERNHHSAGKPGDPILDNHSIMRRNRYKNFKCETCSKTFAKKLILLNHMKIHTGERPFVCKTCDKGFKTEFDLTTHEQHHAAKKPFTCVTCGKGFLRKGTLEVHERTHTGEKPFVCGYCDRSFAQIGGYNVHLRTHTGEKPFKCDQCDVSFSMRGSLELHIRTKHANNTNINSREKSN